MQSDALSAKKIGLLAVMPHAATLCAHAREAFSKTLLVLVGCVLKQTI